MAASGGFWQKLATRSQSNLYFALVFLPGERREAFRDVYRFLRAADDVVDSGVGEAEALAALERWRRELDAVYAGGPSPAHPAAQRLGDTVRRFRLTRAHFETILDALADDVRPRRFPDRAALERWCEAQSSTLGYLCLEILGAAGPTAHAYARDLGVALQLANILRDVDEDAQRGRLYLPVDELARAGASPEDVLARRWSPGYARAAAALAERARELVARGRAGLTDDARRRLLVPEIWADVYLALLAELERVQWDVFTRRPYLRRRRKLAIAALRWLKEERSHVAARLFPQLP
jgi:phytoene synthase